MLKYQHILIFNILNLINKTKKICTIIISPTFHKKLILEILCLKIIIAKTAPTDPPKNVRVNNIDSEILLLCSFALYLSKA